MSTTYNILNQEDPNQEVDDFLNDLTIERNIQVKKIQHDVITINELFKDMATIVNNSSENLDNILLNIEKSKDDTEKGTKELEKAEKSQKKSNIKNLLLAAGAGVIGFAALIGILFGIKK